MGRFLVFQRHGCETRVAGLAAVPLKNEINFGRWRSINMAPLRGLTGQAPKPQFQEKCQMPTSRISDVEKGGFFGWLCDTRLIPNARQKLFSRLAGAFECGVTAIIAS